MTESPIVAWLTGAAVKQAIAKAARSLAEGKSEDVIAQVGSLVEENALLKSDNAVLRNEIASFAKRLDKVRAELDAIKRAVARRYLLSSILLTKRARRSSMPSTSTPTVKAAPMASRHHTSTSLR